MTAYFDALTTAKENQLIRYFDDANRRGWFDYENTRRLTLEDVVDRRNFTSVLQRQYHLLPDHEIERTEVILTVECRSI